MRAIGLGVGLAYRSRAAAAFVPPIPATLTVPWGQNTLRRYGGYPVCFQADGTPVLTGAALAAGFQLEVIADELNISRWMLTVSGVAGTAPPALTGSYAGTITLGAYSCALTINIEAATYDVRPKFADTANLFELKTVLQLTTLAFGDQIKLRAGDYNRGVLDGSAGIKGVGFDQRIRRTVAPVGTWNGSNHVVVSGRGCPSTAFDPATLTQRSMAEYPVRLCRLTIEGFSIATQYLRFTALAVYNPAGDLYPAFDLLKTYAIGETQRFGGAIYSAAAASTGQYPIDTGNPGNTVTAFWTKLFNSGIYGLQLGIAPNPVSFVQVDHCLFVSVEDRTKIENTDTCRASGVSTAGGCSEIVMTDNAFIGLGYGINAAGPTTPATPANHTYERNLFKNCWIDCLRLNNCHPLTIRNNYMFDKGYGDPNNPRNAATGIHGDFIQFANSGLTAGTYAFGTIEGNVLVRGIGTNPTKPDGQGIFHQCNVVGVSFTGAVIQNNLIMCSASNGIDIEKCDSPIVRFNTLIADLQSGYPYAEPLINFVSCTGTIDDHDNIVMAPSNLRSGVSNAGTNNVFDYDTLGECQTCFNNPLFDTALSAATLAAIMNGWKPKSGLLQANGGAMRAGNFYAGAIGPDGGWNSGLAYP